MNIPLFISALTESEKSQLKNYFKIPERTEDDVLTRYLIQNNKLSTKLLNLLYRHSNKGDIFEYVLNINKQDFIRLSGAGETLWKELEDLLIKNNYPVIMSFE